MEPEVRHWPPRRQPSSVEEWARIEGADRHRREELLCRLANDDRGRRRGARLFAALIVVFLLAAFLSAGVWLAKRRLAATVDSPPGRTSSRPPTAIGEKSPGGN